MNNGEYFRLFYDSLNSLDKLIPQSCLLLNMFPTQPSQMYCFQNPRAPVRNLVASRHCEPSAPNPVIEERARIPSLHLHTPFYPVPLRIPARILQYESHPSSDDFRIYTIKFLNLMISPCPFVGVIILVHLRKAGIDRFQTVDSTILNSIQQTVYLTLRAMSPETSTHSPTPISVSGFKR